MLQAQRPLHPHRYRCVHRDYGGHISQRITTNQDSQGSRAKRPRWYVRHWLASSPARPHSCDTPFPRITIRSCQLPCSSWRQYQSVDHTCYGRIMCGTIQIQAKSFQCLVKRGTGTAFSGMSIMQGATRTQCLNLTTSAVAAPAHGSRSPRSRLSGAESFKKEAGRPYARLHKAAPRTNRFDAAE
jgi:hypothetical protein